MANKRRNVQIKEEKPSKIFTIFKWMVVTLATIGIATLVSRSFAAYDNRANLIFTNVERSDFQLGQKMDIKPKFKNVGKVTATHVKRIGWAMESIRPAQMTYDEWYLRAKADMADARKSQQTVESNMPDFPPDADRMDRFTDGEFDKVASQALSEKRLELFYFGWITYDTGFWGKTEKLPFCVVIFRRATDDNEYGDCNDMMK